MFLQKDLKDISFHIMIDDGFHEFNANLNFLLNSFSKLEKGGIYIIEDLDPTSRAALSKILPEIKKSLSPQYIEMIDIPWSFNRFDNSLLILQK